MATKYTFAAPFGAVTDQSETIFRVLELLGVPLSDTAEEAEKSGPAYSLTVEKVAEVGASK